MRLNDHVMDLWEQGGPYIGDDGAPHTRVTAEAYWELHVQAVRCRDWKKSPARWFQRTDLTKQIEFEIPNVKSVNWSRNIGNDAGECQIEIYNQWMNVNGVDGLPDQLGQPGFFTFDRGKSEEARTRWGHETNMWSDVLVPDMLIRVYQGYGGRDKTIAEALDDGNLMQTGTWLVDSVGVSTDGILRLRCRDMAKLLIEQHLYPPLVPFDRYPDELQYCRWVYDDKTITVPPISDRVPPRVTAGRLNLKDNYGKCIVLDDNGDIEEAQSGNDLWYGIDQGPGGHKPSHAFDGNNTTYWLSPGNDRATSPYAVEWIEMCIGGKPVNQVNLKPYLGNYFIMVSVMENGAWMGEAPSSGIVNYEPGATGRYTGLNTAAIPYVVSAGCPWEQEFSINLPRMYRADKIRISITQLQNTGLGAYPYRGGFRSIGAALSRTAPGGSVSEATVTKREQLVYACTPYPAVESFSRGYYQATEQGQVFAFGDARTFPKNTDQPGGAAATHRDRCIRVKAMPDGTGYWTMDRLGKIIAYGSAEHYGDRRSDFSIPSTYYDFAVTPTGLGYWILRWDGVVFSFGDAVFWGNAQVGNDVMPSGTRVEARSIETYPNGDGYWILHSDGTVHGLVDAPDLGDAPRTGYDDTEYVNSIRRSPSGEGYFVVSGSGIVHTFGDASHEGDEPSWNREWYKGLIWDMVVCQDGDGYLLARANGELVQFGGSNDCYFGSIASQVSVLRKDGNYIDYADIIKDLLLWSGWFLFADGNITGGNEFRPLAVCTRQATAAFFHRYNGAPDFTPPDPRGSYADVPPTADFFTEIEWAKSVELMEGYTNGQYFRPKDPITRGALALLFYRDAGEPPYTPPATPTYEDVPTSHIHYLPIEWVTDQGIMSGSGPSGGLLFLPNSSIIRGRVAQLFYAYAGSPAFTPDGMDEFSDVAPDDTYYFWVEWMGENDYAHGWPVSEGAETAYSCGDEAIAVYGNIETTGAWSEECLPMDMFDKQPVIDAINQLRQVVGYIFYIDHDGAAQFHTPNWWGPGNYDELGQRIEFIPDIDELVQLETYSVEFDDANARSEIIISTSDPTADFTDTVTTRIVPDSGSILRGIVKTAMWTNGIFQSKEEQEIMAELIALHIWFSMRKGSVVCRANPCIDIDDQIRIYERVTGESYIHYVRGVQMNHDLDTGDFTMTLETHWLGDDADWAVEGVIPTFPEPEPR